MLCVFASFVCISRTQKKKTKMKKGLDTAFIIIIFFGSAIFVATHTLHVLRSFLAINF